MEVRGRACPLSYRYRPEDLAGTAARSCRTLYVVGGLYGNVQALQAVLARVRKEADPATRVVFNGDFHFLDIDIEDFRSVTEAVLGWDAVQGNVEAELLDPSSEAGCGCAYPDYVDDDTVERSNAIAGVLRRTARRDPALLLRMAALPQHLTVDVAGYRIAVVHGDPESLAGWRLALEAAEPADAQLRAMVGWRGSPTSHEVIADWFRRADADVFACTHTGLPYAQGHRVDGRPRLVANNGSAGLPNFAGTTYGVLTRLSVDPTPPADALYGTTIGTLRYDALPVRYDVDAWSARFLRSWPPGSAAHDAYFSRITHGPRFRLQQAARGGVSLA